jgi:hypothetical protein
MTRGRPKPKTGPATKPVATAPTKSPAVPPTKPAAAAVSKPSADPPSKPAAPPAGKPLVVFGPDEHSKPRGAYFAAANEELVRKAAEAMNLRVFTVDTPDLAALAKKLPIGRLHGNGTAFVPFVRDSLYAKVVYATVGDQQPHDDQKDPPALPAAWDDVAPGHLVIVQETRECGWWEAIVIHRDGDLLTLQYRDYPRYPKFVRHRSAVALISANKSHP